MPTLADEALAIQNLKASYCAAVDRLASDFDGACSMLSTLFTDDFVGDYGFGPLEGKQAILDFLCTAIPRESEWMVHMIHSPRVEIDAEAAEGEWTVMAYMKRRDGGQVDFVLGRYADQFRKTPDGWRIAQVTFKQMV